MSDQKQEGASSFDESAPLIPEPNRKRQYWRGVVYGAIPLAIFLISGVIAGLSPSNGMPNYGVAGLPFAMVGLIGYFILLIVTITYLVNREKRFIGYGLLTMLLITPVVAVYGCLLILQAGRHS